MTEAPPPFPETSWREWLEMVTRDQGPEALEALRSVTLDGIEVEPLYTAETVPSPTPRPVRSVPGWETRATIPVAAGRDLEGRIEELRRLGVTGLWLEIEEGATRDEVAAVCDAAARRGLSLGVEGLGSAALLAASLATGPAPESCLGLDPVALSSRPDLVAEISEWVSERAVGTRPFLLAADRADEAGAGAVFELAWLVSGLAGLLRTGEEAGVSASRIVGGALLRLPVGRDVYLQIAKVRAARILWAMVLGAWDLGAEEHPARILARTSWRTKSRWDAKTNLLRETVESFAAVVGGCDELLTRPFDGAGSGLGERLRLTLPLVLRDESGLGRVEDPAGGSWAVESLTRRLAEDAWEESRRIEGEGGLGASLASGRLAERMESAAETRRRLLRTRREAMTGISVYPRGEAAPAARPEAAPPSLRPADGISWRSLVDAAASGRTMAELRKRFEGPAESEQEGLPRWTDASLFESFRDRAAARPDVPRALLVGIGSLRDLSAPLGFARQLLVAGGFEVEELPLFESPEAARGAVEDRGPEVVVIVLPRDAEAARRSEVVSGLAPAPGVLVLTGRTRVDGAEHYLFAGCDAVSLLEGIWEEIEG